MSVPRRSILAQNDERVTHVDFSATRAAQIGCVVCVLSESIERVKISLIFPKLMEDPENLKRTLRGTVYEAAIGLVDDFMQRRDMLVKEQRSPLMDHGMIKIIDYFQRNYEMYLLFPQFMKRLSQEELKLIQAFEMLFDVAKEHLYRSSKSEISKERKLHQMYHENATIKENLIELNEKLQTQKVALRWKISAKEVFLKKIEDDLAYKKWQNNVRIQNEIEKCSRIIRKNQKVSLEKQTELQEELDRTQAIYKKTTKLNLKQEKHSRAEKNKLLLQLQSLIKKYDSTLGEKKRDNLKLESDYNEAKKRFDDFMVYYKEEEAIYNDIVLKREEEERRQQQQRIVIFMMNRAARQIQKYWRKWRKDQRKKNKKLRKGKKK